MATNRIVPTSVAALLALLVLASPATGNVPDSFTACIGPVQATYCSSGDTYQVGDLLWLRGKVRPPHAGMTAQVQLKEPGSDTWEKVGSDVVADTGKVRWTWRTDVSDSSPDFYRFRWKIPGHGASEIVKVRVVVPAS